MKRRFERHPGYDCRSNPCGRDGCGTRRGSSHGIHNDVWVYTVIDGDVALCLKVGSGVYPETVPPSPLDRDKPSGDYLFLHVAFPTKREQLLPNAGARQACEYVEGGLCYADECGSAADFVKRHFVGKTHEQPESFWLALEERCAVLAREARVRRVDVLYEQCPHCGGVGTVPR